MPLSPPAAIGAQIAADVAGIAPAPGTPITNAQLILIWTAVVTRIYTDLHANAQVSPGTFTSTAPGTPIAGVGGPIL